MSTFLEIVHGASPAQEPQPAPAAEPVAPVDPAAAAPEPVSDPAAPAFDESAYLSELTGGLVKSRDEFGGILERSKAADEVTTLREQLQTAHPNEFTKSVAEMVRAGASASQLKTFIDLSLTEDISTIDDYEAMVKATYLKESDTLTADDAKLLIDSRYPKSAEELAEEKGLSEDEAQKQFRLLDIQRRKEVKEAKEFLQSFRKDVYQNVVTGGKAGQLAAIEKAWQPVLPAISKQLEQDAVRIEVADEQAGIQTAFEIKMPKEFVDQVAKTIPQWAANSGLELNAENTAFIVQEAKKAYIANNYQALIESAIRDTWSKAAKAKEEEFSNPQKVARPTGQAAPIEAGSWMKDFFN